MNKVFVVALLLSIIAHGMLFVYRIDTKPADLAVHASGASTLQVTLVEPKPDVQVPQITEGAKAPDVAKIQPQEQSHVLPKEAVEKETTSITESAEFVSASVIGNAPPKYPRLARLKKQEGHVVLNVEIMVSGSVGKIEVLASSGYHLLDDAAVAAVKQWQFSPAKQGGKSLSSWVEIPITFRLKQTA